MRRHDAVKVFYGLEFFDSIGLHAAFTVWAVYLVQDVGVNRSPTTRACARR